jgi:DNA-binding transcriptional regulator YiaG
MTPTEFNRIRQDQGLSIAETARILRIADRSTIHRWATGDRAISGPASLLMRAIDKRLITIDELLALDVK